MSNNRKIKVGSLTDLTINSSVRLATAVNLFIQYPHKKLESQLWCGEEVENYGGNDPVVHNDRHVKGKEEGKAEAASCFWWALTVHHQLRRRCWRKSKPSRRGNRSGLSAGGTLQYALRQLRRRGGVCQLNNDCGLENSLECTGRQAVLSKSAQSKQYLRTSRQQIVDVFSNGKTTVDGHAECLDRLEACNCRWQHLQGTSAPRRSPGTSFGSASNCWHQPTARHLQFPMHKTVHWLQVQQDKCRLHIYA